MTCMTRDGTEQRLGQAGRNHVPPVIGERPPARGFPVVQWYTLHSRGRGLGSTNGRGARATSCHNEHLVQPSNFFFFFAK